MNKLNVKLLKAVKKAILEEPKRLDMNCGLAKSNLNICGTIGCIAGWAVILDKRGKSRKPIKEILESLINNQNFVACRDWVTWDNLKPMAENALGLTRIQAKMLFFDANWPEPFKREYWESPSVKSAEITVKRIDYFIKTRK